MPRHASLPRPRQGYAGWPTIRHHFATVHMPNRPVNLFDHYHAHIYFGPASVAQATQLCRQAGELFGVTVGRVHEREVGPHPHWSCQLAFDKVQFDQLIPWLEANRDGLDVFVHGETGDGLADHTTNASWLGNASELRLDLFRRGAPPM
jgi:aromatic ring-cleaving dioxygenase